MAGTTNKQQQQFNSQMFLSPNQQDLLMAALNSNNNGGQNIFGNGQQDFSRHNGMGAINPSQVPQGYSLDGVDPSFFTPQQDVSAGNFNAFDMKESPYVDFLDGGDNFDFDNADNSDLMIGNLPGDSPENEDIGDSPEKRKSPEDDDDQQTGDAKRQHPEGDKQAKKPGRKPLTSEPTTKRKAQNRAAQRAFRERKEKHLKDLETKADELQKQMDATNHENGLLKAQVQRLQTELREYRKRLSLNASMGRTSLPSNGFSFSNLANSGGNNNFQFEFPRFGGLPGTHMLNKSASPPALGSGQQNANNAPGVLARQSSNGRGHSPKSQGTTPASNQDQTSSPSLNNGFAGSHSYDLGFSAKEAPPKQTSVSSTNTDSPSASSVSQYGGGTSSCGTSPEPSHNSPGNSGEEQPKDTLKDGYICHGNSEGEITFCEKLNMACGNPRNPVPRAKSVSNGKPANAPAAPNSNLQKPSTPAPAAKSPAANSNGFNFNPQSDGGFDPVLFGDYRESQAAIVGDGGDFTSGFFDDAFNLNNYGSPNFHFGDTPAVSTANKPNPLEQIEKLQDGDDEEVVPGEDITQMLNCHKIWDKLAQHPEFKEGNIDIDGLCTELRAKARCSESGVVVDNKDVEAALKRLPSDGPQPQRP